MPINLSKKNRKIAKIIWGFTLAIWVLLTLGIIADFVANGKIPADSAAYFEALEQFQNNNSPYHTTDASKEKWQEMHSLEQQVISGELEAFPKEKISGPFIYPPTLLQLMDALRMSPIGFMAWLLGCLVLFGWIWLKITKISTWWLLFFLFSWDVLVSFTLGNIEIILLTSTLLSAYWLYTGRSIWAAPLIAFVGLVKPFYVLFFVAFGVFMLVTNHRELRSTNFRSMAKSAMATMFLLPLAVLLWPAWLRPLVFEYIQDGMAHSWYILPVGDQTPMSIWNRTFMQGLVNLGIPVGIAQTCSLIAWCLVTGLTVTQVWKRALPFPLLFAFSLLLFYWFRPVGWSLIFLDVVILSAVWPYTSTKEKRWLLLGAVSLALTHWVALIKTGELLWLRLVTLQSATLPLETWLVFPIGYFVLLFLGARRVPLNSHSAA